MNRSNIQFAHGSPDTISESIQQIQAVINSCSTESVVGWCMVKHLQGFPSPDLSSPAKQMYFLLGLTVESHEPSQAREFGANDWQRIVKPLESLFSAYRELHYASQGTLAEQSEHWVKIREVSSIAFIAYFNQGLLASVEQVTDRIRTYLTPFDDQLAKDFGISPSDALDIAQWISRELQTRLDEFNEGATEAIFRLGKLSQSDLIGRYGAKAQTFWELFTIGRGQGEQLKYPTDSSIVEERPLIRLSDDVAMCFSLNALFTSILIRSEQCLSKGAVKKRYFRSRDKTIEDQAASVFIRILGDEAEVHRNLYETPDNHNEHDLVILAKEMCLFVEVKASPPHEPFRDPERAFIRLRHDFRSDGGIQKAYDQALRLLNVTRTKKELILYDQGGNEALRLPPDIAHKVFCVCVTRDSYGPLATYLPFLLEKEKDDPYPWSVNILDLENLAQAWDYFGWDARQLKAYLSQRIQFHTQLFSGDELDYTGAFVSHCGLQYLIHDDVFVVLAANYSNIFDEIHAHLHYGEPPVKIKPVYPASADIRESFRAGKSVLVKGLPEGPIIVGRNDRCPCESGVKFKRCHGK